MHDRNPSITSMHSLANSTTWTRLSDCFISPVQQKILMVLLKIYFSRILKLFMIIGETE